MTKRGVAEDNFKIDRAIFYKFITVLAIHCHFILGKLMYSSDRNTLLPAD